jgi:hypothetical protein
MPTPSTFTVPEGVTFEQEIALTQTLLADMAAQNLTEPEIAAAIGALMQSINGARGFWVTYLAGSTDLADHPSSGVLQALKAAPTSAATLLVKNVAMSTAMAITHRRNENLTLAAGSDQVRRRCEYLIAQLARPDLADQMASLLDSIQTGVGEYQEFLDRWHYDDEQRQAIGQVIERVRGIGG